MLSELSKAQRLRLKKLYLHLEEAETLAEQKRKRRKYLKLRKEGKRR